MQNDNASQNEANQITVSYKLLKHIPNALTGIRLLLILPFLVCLYRHQYVSAFYLYLLAGFTDGLDGWLARHYNWQSTLGSFIDPLADKLLIASSFISLALIGSLPWWLVVLVFMRDFTISMGVMAWYWLVQRQLDFKPTFLSKINTTLQIGLVTLCMFELAYFQVTAPWITQTLIIITAFTTAVTYLHYVCVWGKKAYSIHTSCP
ncbi:CDP-alcohol phosphatidyltransferase family protein [Legionella sp. CNM-4043-24]|uniref:CDP-alcohol phosphatidyltransferase family protein n=1 Tax=Legionella sp. CNM-4043-24 TaxID=3421646 RepID=UPI00403AB647